MEKNENKKRRTVLFLCFLGIMVCACLVSKTFAKYTSTVSGTSTVGVAKWDFTIDETSLADVITNGSKYTFDLFKTIKDTGGATESDVKTGFIAPGTSGSITVSVKNNSDVNARYKFEFEEDNTTGAAIVYSIDGGTTWTTAADNSTTFEVVNMGATKTVTLDWKWAFDVTNDDTANTDVDDTAIGLAAAKNALSVNVTAKLVLEQVD